MADALARAVSRRWRWNPTRPDRPPGCPGRAGAATGRADPGRLRRHQRPAGGRGSRRGGRGVRARGSSGWSTSASPGCTGCSRRATQLRQARVVIVVAGMEGALPSVVGGLVAAPVIAVPTSVGYGAVVRRAGRAARHAQLVRRRRDGGEHRQRLRRRRRREPDLPGMTIRTVLERSDPPLRVARPGAAHRRGARLGGRARTASSPPP